MLKKKKKIAVAMSGGVDSSVAAFLLLQKGYEVVGVHMRLGLDSARAENAARKVCQKLGIKFYPLNLAADFRKNVKDYFVESYEAGFTPNPCVNCNKLIKFGELLKRVNDMGVDYLATGHYIRQRRKFSIFSRILGIKFSIKLLKGIDAEKDQSYFLYNLNQNILKKIIFPLGDFAKKEVKKIAKDNNLPVLEGESQDICFLSGNHNDYLKENIKLKKGDIVCDDKVVGEHNGLPLYTIGQRRGVEIGGDGPYYVVKTDYKTNTLRVSKNHDDPLLYSDKLVIKDVNWISSKEINSIKCQASIRYGHKAEECEVLKNGEGEYEVLFSKPQRAVTPGQSIVFYQGNELLGGGVIQ